MDVLQVHVIEKILNLILHQGPIVIDNLKILLALIAAGGHYVKAIYDLVNQYPGLIEVVNQLLALIISGAGITEIVTALTKIIISKQVPIEAVIQLLQILLSLIIGGGSIVF